MGYNKKTQRKRSRSASKSRRRRSRGGDIEDGEPDPYVAELMKPPNRSISPTNFPPPSYAETMKMYPRRSSPHQSPSLSTKIFDKYDAAEKGEAGSNLVGGKRRKGRRSARRGKRSKKTRNGKRSTKKKSLFGKLFGL